MPSHWLPRKIIELGAGKKISSGWQASLPLGRQEPAFQTTFSCLLERGLCVTWSVSQLLYEGFTYGGRLCDWSWTLASHANCGITCMET